MNREDMLARLIAQASTEGSDLVTLRAIVEEASELGADRVLGRLGLNDPTAQDDIDELRELLSAWKAAVSWLVRGVMALLLIGIAVRLGLPGLLK